MPAKGCLQFAIGPIPGCHHRRPGWNHCQSLPIGEHSGDRPGNLCYLERLAYDANGSHGGAAATETEPAGIGHLLIDALAERKAAGVDVRVINQRFKSVPDRRPEPVPGDAWFHPVFDYAIAQGIPIVAPCTKGGGIDHTKYLVVDGVVALFGGMNFADSVATNRDLMLEVRGPFVGELRDLFALAWECSVTAMREAGTLPAPTAEVRPLPSRPSPAPVTDSDACRTSLLTTSPITRNISAAIADTLASAGAGDSIRIAMLLLTDHDLREALVEVRERGAEVRVLLDPSAGFYNVDCRVALNAEHAMRLLDGGVDVRLFANEPGQELHMKAFALRRTNGEVTFGLDRQTGRPQPCARTGRPMASFVAAPNWLPRCGIFSTTTFTPGADQSRKRLWPLGGMTPNARYWAPNAVDACGTSHTGYWLQTRERCLFMRRCEVRKVPAHCFPAGKKSLHMDAELRQVGAKESNIMPVRFKSVRYLRWSVGPIAACSLFGCLAAVRTVKVAPEECTQLEPVSVEAPCPGMRDGLSQRERLACVSEGEMVLRGAAEEAKADTITGVRGQVDDDGYWRGTADAFRCGPVEPERTEAEIPRFKPGLGVAFGGDITRGLGLTSARVPIVYGPPEAGLQLRVEPELGLLHVNGDVEAKITQLGGTIALGAWRDRTLLSGGVRSGVILLHEGELDRTDFRVGVVAGGEYFPSARFSLGAEVYLDYTKTGSWKQAGKTTQSSDSSTVFLGGALAARFYWF